MGKSFKKKKNTKKTLKKGGFNTTQLNVAIALSSFYDFDKIRLIPQEKVKELLPIIEFDYLLTTMEQKKSFKSNELKITKQNLGKNIYTTKGRSNILVKIGDQEIGKDIDNFTCQLKDYDIYIINYKKDETGNVTEEIMIQIPGSTGGNGTSGDDIALFIKEQIKEKKIKSRKMRGGYTNIQDSTQNVDKFVLNSFKNGDSIISTSIVIGNDKSLELSRSLVIQKLIMSGTEDIDIKLNNLLFKNEIEINQQNLLLLSYIWGISKLSAENLMLLSELENEGNKSRDDQIIYRGATNIIQNATGISVSSNLLIGN